MGLLITQTGGGCRASNYIHLLRKALEKADMGYIPVVSVNLSGLEKNPGFSLTLPFIRKAVFAMMYGDTVSYTHLAEVDGEHLGHQEGILLLHLLGEQQTASFVIN